MKKWQTQLIPETADFYAADSIMASAGFTPRILLIIGRSLRSGVAVKGSGNDPVNFLVFVCSCCDFVIISPNRRVISEMVDKLTQILCF